MRVLIISLVSSSAQGGVTIGLICSDGGRAKTREKREVGLPRSSTFLALTKRGCLVSSSGDERPQLRLVSYERSQEVGDLIHNVALQ